MNKLWIARLIVGLAVLGDPMKVCPGATADSLKAGPTITLDVYNYAGVSPKTLLKAERVAAGIFRKTGVNTAGSKGV